MSIVKRIFVLVIAAAISLGVWVWAAADEPPTGGSEPLVAPVARVETEPVPARALCLPGRTAAQRPTELQVLRLGRHRRQLSAHRHRASGAAAVI